MNMYNIRAALQDTKAFPEQDTWEYKIICTHADAAMTMATNGMTTRPAIFSYTLVLSGTSTVVYNGQMVELCANDILVYSPGVQVSIHSVSDDYQGIVLVVDEYMALETQVLRNMIRSTYFPVFELQEPRQPLTADESRLLVSLMELIHQHIRTENLHKEETLKALYTVFLADLRTIQEGSVSHHRLAEHTEELFVSFVRLSSEHFVDHRDLSFYAQQLCISSSYLSRIVRQVTGRTVLDHINRLVTMEAAYLLSTTDLTIAQIADRLHFAETSSFVRFFRREKGQNPLAFRKVKG